MKEHLKMTDMFCGIEATRRGNELVCGDVLFAKFVDGDECEYAVHAINSHDDLVAEVERLRGMVIRMQTYLDMAGEYPEKESDNPVRNWMFDALDCIK